MGREAGDHTLYASHTVWGNRAVFEAWTKSEAFRAAHSRAGDNKLLYLDHPQFEEFEVRQTVRRGRQREGSTHFLVSMAAAVPREDIAISSPPRPRPRSVASPKLIVRGRPPLKT